MNFLPEAEAHSASTPAVILIGQMRALVRAAWLRARLTSGVLMASLLIGYSLGLVLPKRFPATAEFLPDADRSRSSLSAALQGFASQLGGISSVGDSPQFYADLLASRRILTSLLYKEYAATPGTATRRLIDVLGISAADSARARERGLSALRRSITTSVDPRTGVVAFTVEANTPELAMSLCNDLLAGVNEVNVQIRQTRATAALRFLREQLSDAEGDLNRAEGAIKSFLTENRAFDSPRLRYEQARLQRAYDLANEVYMTQHRALNEAAQEASRNTPTLIVVSGPQYMSRPSAPNRPFILAASLALGVIVLLAFLWREASLGTAQPG